MSWIKSRLQLLNPVMNMQNMLLKSTAHFLRSCTWIYCCRANWSMMFEMVTVLASILASSKDLKRIQIPHHLFWHFRADNTIPTICWSGSIAAADFKFILISSPYSSSGKHSKRLLHKAIRGFDCNERFWLENKWTSSSWGSAQTLLWLVGQASTNTGCIHVICSRCWQWLAFFRKSSHFCLLT